MGKFEKSDDQWVYRQDNGEITARFIDYRERKILSHESDPAYRKAFLILVALGVTYLVILFAVV